MAKLPDRSRAG